MAWLAALNPHADRAAAITVRLLLERGDVLERQFTVPRRSRRSFEVAALFGLQRGDHAFGLEVECDGCAASLVMWDASYTTPAVSAPIVGCRF